VREGIAWYRRQPFLRAIIVVVGATNVLYTALFLVLIVRARELGSSPALIGAMFSCAGGGAIVGALVAPYVQRNVAAKLIFIGVLWLDAVGFALFVVLPNAIAFGIDLGLLALLSPPFNVVVTSYRYAVVPDRLLGRTASVARLITWGSIPLGPLLGGFLVEAVATRPTLGILAGGMLVVAAAAAALPSIRSAPDLRRLLAGVEEQASLN
jgi:predicted MFS family arabinose efflux permease